MPPTENYLDPYEDDEVASQASSVRQREKGVTKRVKEEFEERRALAKEKNVNTRRVAPNGEKDENGAPIMEVMEPGISFRTTPLPKSEEEVGPFTVRVAGDLEYASTLAEARGKRAELQTKHGIYTDAERAEKPVSERRKEVMATPEWKQAAKARRAEYDWDVIAKMREKTCAEKMRVAVEAAKARIHPYMRSFKERAEKREQVRKANQLPMLMHNHDNTSVLVVNKDGKLRSTKRLEESASKAPAAQHIYPYKQSVRERAKDRAKLPISALPMLMRSHDGLAVCLVRVGGELRPLKGYSA